MLVPVGKLLERPRRTLTDWSTGFVDAKVREPGSRHNGVGILQLVSLARLLQREGYAFWNLGHPFNEKKGSVSPPVSVIVSFTIQ